MNQMLSYLGDGGWLMALLTAVGLAQGALVLALIGALRAARLAQAQDLLAPLRAVVAALPLLGLLGTVGGMMLCFDGSAAGGDPAQIASGVAAALHTTHYALGMAVPGLLAERLLSAAVTDRSLQADAHV